MKKEYRSAIRSRKLIRQAFMELLKEKPFEKVTVTDIVNRADINRSTFYAHYPDVMGLLDEIPERYVNSFEFEFAVRFFLGGFIDVYTQWIKGELDCTVEDIIQGVSNMIVMVYEKEKRWIRKKL